MTKVFHFLPEKLAFDWFQLQSDLNYSFQYHLQMMQVLFQCLRKDKNIIYIDGHKVRAIFRVESHQHLLYESLEDSRGVCRPNSVTRNSNNP